MQKLLPLGLGHDEAQHCLVAGSKVEEVRSTLAKGHVIGARVTINLVFIAIVLPETDRAKIVLTSSIERQVVAAWAAMRL